MAYRAKGPIKLIRSIRGKGVLRTTDGEVDVTYHIDTYEERGGVTSSGSLDGDASGIADGSAGRLRLENGEEFDVQLIKPDEDGVDFITPP